jgi:type 1 glutamine amidotransferase
MDSSLTNVLAEKRTMRTIISALLFATLIFNMPAAELPTVLVYTHNGPTTDGKKGYVHDNISDCVKAIEKLGGEMGFKATHSDDPAVFTKPGLKKYAAIIFANSNNSAFDTEEQRKAFQEYIQSGGGFVGIHSATGSERNSPWFSKLIGGTFAWHAPLQKFTVQIVDKNHPATSFFKADTWDWEDEFYVMKEQPKDVRVLLAGNVKPLRGVGEKAAGLPDVIPLAWCHEFEGARSFYTALGHKKEYYSDPMYLKHLAGGIRWALKMENSAP